MSRLRYYQPSGRAWVTVTPGAVWYTQTEDQFIVCALLSGAWGGEDFQEKYGPWDEDVDQLWTVTIPKSRTERHEYEGVSWDRVIWESMYWELGNKPHRSISDGVRHGEVVRREAVTDHPEARQCHYRMVMYKTPADRRAVRLWAQARVKREEARRRRLRRSRYRMERGEWAKKPRRYNRYWRRRAQEDARW